MNSTVKKPLKYVIVPINLICLLSETIPLVGLDSVQLPITKCGLVSLNWLQISDMRRVDDLAMY